MQSSSSSSSPPRRDSYNAGMPWCEPKAIHVGWMHNISAANISTWANPIDLLDIASESLELNFASSSSNNDSSNDNNNSNSKTATASATTAASSSSSSSPQNQGQNQCQNEVQQKQEQNPMTLPLTEKELELGTAHFESLLKDNDLTDDRHLRRIMEILIAPGVYLPDHDVPRYNPYTSGFVKSSAAQDEIGGASSANLAALPQKIPLKWNWTVLKLSQFQYLAAFISVSTVDEYCSLGFAIHLDCDSYATALRQARWMCACGAVRLLVAAPDRENPSTSLHAEFVDQVAKETWRRSDQLRWKHFINAVRRYSIPRQELFYHVLAHSELSMTLPASKDSVAALPDFRAIMNTDLNDDFYGVMTTGISMPNILAAISAEGGTRGGQLLEAAQSQREGGGSQDQQQQEHDQKKKQEHQQQENEIRNIVIVHPSVFPPNSFFSYIKSFPPAKYLLNYQSVIEQILLQGYMVQLPTDLLPKFAWQAWSNFFHTVLFSMLPNVEDDMPLSVCHSSLSEGLVPGTFVTAVPARAGGKRGIWDATLHVFRFLFDKQKEELAFNKPVIQTSSSKENSAAISALFTCLVPHMKKESNIVSLNSATNSSTASFVSGNQSGGGGLESFFGGASTASMSPSNHNNLNNASPSSSSSMSTIMRNESFASASTMNNNNSTSTKSAAASAEAAAMPESAVWLEPNIALCEAIQNWRCHVQRAVSDLEFRVSRLFFCSSRLGTSLANSNASSTSSSAITSSSSSSAAPNSPHSPLSYATPQTSLGLSEFESGGGGGGGGSNNSAGSGSQNSSGLVENYVRCGCDRCQEDTELLLKCDPFLLRLMNPIGKQLQRLLKRLVPTSGSIRHSALM